MAYLCGMAHPFLSIRTVVILLFSWLTGLTVLQAQTVHGVVTDADDYILPGAQVYLSGTQVSGFADSMGGYRLSWEEGLELPVLLIARQVGYVPDTIRITGPGYTHIRLVSDARLETVTVNERRDGQFVDELNPIRTEVVSALELQKGACCDLAGCFNTNATVQKNVTNVITQAQELRILGLGGVYNQVLLEGFPMIQGLSYTYGVSALPGAWVDNIYISKGANSVLQGWESISGQINVELREPETAPMAFMNGYINSFGEKQVNGVFRQDGEGWGNLLFFHTAQPGSRRDIDNDGFLDFPLVSRYGFTDRLHLGTEAGPGWSLKAGIRLTTEERIGGQQDYQPEDDAGTQRAYGQWVRYQEPEVWAKTAFRWNDQHRLVLFASGLHHDQRSWYGLTRYRARQSTANVVLQHEWDPGEDFHLKSGISYRHHDLKESLSFSENPLQLEHDGTYARTDQVAGVFAEQTTTFWSDRLTWILGARLDHHQDFGVFFTPRTLLKADLWTGSSLRGSIGWGWRTANVFSENVMLLAGNRQVVFPESLTPEKAMNWGVNMTQRFNLGSMTGRWGADYYQTRFTDQIFPDFLQDPRTAVVANFTEPSTSRAFQTDLDLTPLSGLQVKVAYNFLEVVREVDGRQEILPFNSRHRLLAALSYATPDGRWQWDLNAHWYGPQQLPNTQANPEEFRRPDQSPDYSVLNAQVTIRLTPFEIYTGCENILDFRQRRPILGWQDPFGPWFDSSSVWGATRGREFYLGVRWNWTRQ